MNNETPKREVVRYEDEIDLFEYIEILAKYWKRIVAISLLAGLVTYVAIPKPEIIPIKEVASVSVSTEKNPQKEKLEEEISAIKEDMARIKATIDLAKNVSLEGKYAQFIGEKIKVYSDLGEKKQKKEKELAQVTPTPTPSSKPIKYSMVAMILAFGFVSFLQIFIVSYQEWKKNRKE